VQRHFESVGVFGQPHSVQTARHHLRVTVRTPLRDFCATCYRIPRFVSSFYFCCLGGHYCFFL
jgi:hypothetical protein